MASASLMIDIGHQSLLHCTAAGLHMISVRSASAPASTYFANPPPPLPPCLPRSIHSHLFFFLAASYLVSPHFIVFLSFSPPPRADATLSSPNLRQRVPATRTPRTYVIRCGSGVVLYWHLVPSSMAATRNPSSCRRAIARHRRPMSISGRRCACRPVRSSPVVTNFLPPAAREISWLKSWRFCLARQLHS
jgi:hypothetical protein